LQTTYKYTARDETGKAVKGVMAAESEVSLDEVLTSRGYTLTMAAPHKPRAIGLGRASKRDVVDFAIQIGSVLEAGVPLSHGLRDLSEQTVNAYLRKVIKDIARNVEGGLTFSEALGRHPKVFPEIFISMVTAGEATGSLDEALMRAASYLDWEVELVAKIKEILTYPLVVIIAIGGVAAFLFSFVLPRFAQIFEKTNAPLPILTRALLSASAFCTSYWYLLLGGTVALVLVPKLWRKTQRGRLQIDRVKLGIPLIGGLVRKVALSRFSHTFSSLHKAGVGTADALLMVEKSVGNSVIARAIRTARERVISGERIADSLEKSGEFSPLVIRMISVGEETGKLDEVLGKVSMYYDREVPRTIKKLFAVLEPVMVLMMGTMVAVVAISMLLPLYQMIALVSR
jgi:type IV pilus assembly protein PilC